MRERRERERESAERERREEKRASRRSKRCSVITYHYEWTVDSRDD